MIIIYNHIANNKTVTHAGSTTLAAIDTAVGVSSNKYGLLYRERRTKGKSIYSPKMCRACEKAPVMTAAKPRSLARTNGRGAG